ncbi:hypothetical protein [Streptomyces sp. NPDC001816]|uniref:hypothetical protein n=1 Tax=Streptomyces sp. NPDC001816 TaxID=3364612 RepID=UPI0036A4A666
MLRILDARTGEPVAAAPARRGLTRIEAYASGLDLTALRVLLTADVLVRALELGGTPVWTILTAPHRHAELRTAATHLAIRPFEDGRDLASGLGEAQVIHVVAEDTATMPSEGPLLTVAPAVWTAAEPGDDEQLGGSGGSPRDGAGTGGHGSDTASDAPPHTATTAGEAPAPRSSGDQPPLGLPALLSDPTALRLALLSVPRNTAVRLDADGLGAAAQSLARWRRAVAGWARQPSRPVPDAVRVRLRAAWEDDLDLPGVLAVLRDVESAPELPDGARFETYVYADRLLALDLARDLGSFA